MKYLTYILSIIAVAKAGFLHHHEGAVYKVKLISMQNIQNDEHIQESVPVIKVVHQGFVESQPEVYKIIHDYSTDGNVYHTGNYNTPEVIKVIHEKSTPQAIKSYYTNNNLNNHFHESEVIKVIHKNTEDGHINHTPERILHLIHEHRDNIAIDVPLVMDESSGIDQNEKNIKTPETSILPPVIEPAPVFDSAAIAMDALYEAPAFSVPEPTPAETYGTPAFRY